jgi:WD40 repeat protein
LGQRAFSASDDGDLVEWDLARRTPERTITVGIPVERIAATDRCVAVVGSLDAYQGQFGTEWESRVQLISAGAAAPLTLIEHSGGLKEKRYTAAQLSEDARRLILAREPDDADRCDFARIELWDLEELRLVREIPHPDKYFRTMLLLPGSMRLVTATKSISIWDLADPSVEPVTFGAEDSSISAIALSPDYRQLAVGRADGSIEIWDVASGTLLDSFIAHDGQVEGIVYVDDSPALASIGLTDKCFKVWKEGKLDALLVGDDPFSALAITPDRATFIVGDASGRVHFMRLEQTRSAS